jgi:hypothetical protein
MRFFFLFENLLISMETWTSLWFGVQRLSWLNSYVGFTCSLSELLGQGSLP